MSRIILVGPPSSGKSGAILNLVIHQSFDRIIIFHNDPNSREYSDLDAEMYDEIIDPRDEELAIDPSIKNLVIFEDILYKYLPLIQRKYLTDYFTTFSTHKSITCYLTAQDFFNQIPTNIRRCANVFVLFKSIDMNNLRNLCSCLNLNFKDMKFIFENYLTSKYDNLVVDLNRSDKKLRKNFVEILNV